MLFNFYFRLAMKMTRPFQTVSRTSSPGSTSLKLTASNTKLERWVLGIVL